MQLNIYDCKAIAWFHGGEDSTNRWVGEQKQSYTSGIQPAAARQTAGNGMEDRCHSHGTWKNKRISGYENKRFVLCSGTNLLLQNCAAFRCITCLIDWLLFYLSAPKDNQRWLHKSLPRHREHEEGSCADRFHNTHRSAGAHWLLRQPFPELDLGPHASPEFFDKAP